jgi:putative (di)nucleoside polyphosphate hydrolase
MRESGHRSIDSDGYRPNVGIILCNGDDQVLWARRRRHDGWQFPQGGVEKGESIIDAVYRELFEEVGLLPTHVEVIGCTQQWLRYDVPRNYLRSSGIAFRGQKQMWYLLRMLADDTEVCLDHSEQPEFDEWRWVDYWLPLEQIVPFKRTVYRRALTELEPMLIQLGAST